MRRRFWSSSVVRLALLISGVWCVYAALVLLLAPRGISTVPILDAGLALMLGLLMTIRTNRSYERWWEGRTLWGTLVNASRNLAVKVAVYAQPDEREARRMHELLTAFAYGLRDHLREGARLADLPGDDTDEVQHIPSLLVKRIEEKQHAWVESGRILPEELRMLDLETRILLDVCGGCERIRKTALPHSLTWITRLSVATALLLIPWFLGAELGWGIVPVAGLAAFLMLVSEAVANAMEHPFGRELNQLDLTSICEAIDASTAEILEVQAAPRDPTPA